jgi:2-oxoisovalerate ferredoxin oxidoreductase delta subunit
MTTDNEPYPVINVIECKACGRCVIACPKELLNMSEDINKRGYHYAVYKGSGCIGCGNCYYTCPEPLAIEVRIPNKNNKSASRTQ